MPASRWNDICWGTAVMIMAEADLSPPPLPTAYGPDSRPPMAIFELLDYIVNEVSVQTWLWDNALMETIGPGIYVGHFKAK